MAVPFHLPILVDRALARALSQIERVLMHAVATGEDARKTAARIGKFLSPHFAKRRNETGRVVRADRPGNLANWPAASGMGSAGIRAIAGYEITRAHGARAVVVAQRTPGLGIKWTLSAAHGRTRDECDGNAGRDGYGLGRGVYPPHAVPVHPNHVGCLCQLLTVRLAGAESGGAA